MRELYRRLGALAFLFAALLMFFAVRNGFVRLYAMDMGKAYRSAYSPSQGLFGAQAAAGTFIRSTTPFRPVTEFIESTTANRLTEVEGDPWPEIFTGILFPSAQSSIAWREAGDTYRKSFYYHLGEEPFSSLVPRMAEKDERFRYLKHVSPSGPGFLAMSVEGPGTALDNGVPPAVARPFRSLAAWPLLLGAALYLFLPRKKHPAGTILYPRWSAVILPDIFSFLIAGFFLALPMVLAVHIFNSSSILDFREGSAWLTLVFWSMGMIFASILYWSAKYASFALQVLPGEIHLETLGKEQCVAFSDIELADFVDYRPPKWLRSMMFIAGLANWRMMGQALLLSGRRDWGVTLILRNGEKLKFLCSNIPGADKIFQALRLHKIPFSQELESMTAEAAGNAPEEKTDSQGTRW